MLHGLNKQLHIYPCLLFTSVTQTKGQTPRNEHFSSFPLNGCVNFLHLNTYFPLILHVNQILISCICSLLSPLPIFSQTFSQILFFPPYPSYIFPVSYIIHQHPSSSIYWNKEASPISVFSKQNEMKVFHRSKDCVQKTVLILRTNCVSFFFVSKVSGKAYNTWLKNTSLRKSMIPETVHEHK